MYNHLLDTFIAVADCGSFTRAAGKLFISPTAVMKQMNALEAQLDLKLTERTPSGIRLTKAGAVIYQDARFLIDYSRKSLASARAALLAEERTFCVGTSLLNPAKPFMDLWYRVNQDFPDYKLHLVSFEDDHNGILSEIENTCDRVMIISKGKIVANGTTAELRRDSSSGYSLRISIKGDDTPVIHEALCELPQVQDIQILHKQEFELRCAPESEIEKNIFELCKNNDWYITEMTPIQTRLEDVFRQVTQN